MSELLKEAFKELKNLNEDVFSFDKEGLLDLDRYLKCDDAAPDTVDVIDLNAEEAEDLCDSYRGKLTLQCCVCKQLIYQDSSDVVIDPDLKRANVDLECPHCGCMGGYKIVGQVSREVDRRPKASVDGQDVEIQENSANKMIESKGRAIAEYFDSVENGKGWVTLDQAVEDLGRTEEEIANWLEDRAAGYIYNFGDVQVICTINAPSFDDIMDQVLGQDSLQESFQKATVETADTTISMETSEDGKVTVVSQPREAEETGEEVVAPVPEDVKAEVEAQQDQPGESSKEIAPEEAAPEEAAPEESATDSEGDSEQEVDFDQFDENSFDSLGESYFHKVYNNVQSFQTTGGSIDDNKLLIEGTITFNSGKKARTQFLFEGVSLSRNGKLKFLGENAQISNRKHAFTLQGTVSDKKLITESLTYSYRALDSKTGKSCALYGTVKNKK